LDEGLIVSPERASDMIALDDVLTALAALDQRKGRIVELRYFGGFTIEETAELLGVSAGTVMKDWTLAKAWLQREIKRRRMEAWAFPGRRMGNLFIPHENRQVNFKYGS
jgi:DNA-directed RNA polymerase specialized sigma24 family protein